MAEAVSHVRLNTCLVQVLSWWTSWLGVERHVECLLIGSDCLSMIYTADVVILLLLRWWALVVRIDRPCRKESVGGNFSCLACRSCIGWWFLGSSWWLQFGGRMLVKRDVAGFISSVRFNVNWLPLDAWLLIRLLRRESTSDLRNRVHITQIAARMMMTLYLVRYKSVW